MATLLYDAGAPDHLIAAGGMHDLIEKTDVTASDLRQRFGRRVTANVLAVSGDDQIRGYAVRKAALRRQVARAGDETLTLFAADKVSKVRELRREAANGDSKPTVRRAPRVLHYQRSLALLEERLPGSPLVEELRGELRPFLRSGWVLAAPPTT